MTFLHPILLAAGVSAIAIPILVHFLMRRRRKPIAWGAMRFILEAYKQQRRRLKLEQWLLLAARCLLIALVAAAIARPMLGSGALLAGRGPIELYLVIDDSLTSSAAGAGGVAAIERHKQQAADLLAALNPAAGDRAALVTLAAPARGWVVPPSGDLAEVRRLVSELAPTDSRADFEAAIGRLRPFFAGRSASSNRAVVAVLSDFLTGSAGVERSLAPLATDGRDPPRVLVSRPAEIGVDNATIVGVTPLRRVVVASGTAAQPDADPVSVLVRRSGPSASGAAGAVGGGPATTAVHLRVAAAGESASGSTQAQGVVRWEPGQREARVTIPVALPASREARPTTPPTFILTASLDADGIGGDNLWRRMLEVRPTLRVGIVSPRRALGSARPSLAQLDPADWIKLALSPGAEPRSPSREGESRAGDMEPIEVDPGALDAARLSALDALVVTRPDLVPEDAWPRLRAFAEGGGLVVVTPPTGVAVHLWPDAMLRTLGLPWSIGGEAKTYAEATTIAGQRPAGGASENDLLGLIDADLPELVKPVKVFRVLPAEPLPGTQALSDRVLALADGSALMLAAPPGSAEGRGERDTKTDAERRGTQESEEKIAAERRATQGQTGQSKTDQSKTDAERRGTQEGGGRGLVVLFTVPFSFDWTDLPAKPLMLPLLHETLKQGIGRARGTYSAVAGGAIDLPPRTAELRRLDSSASIAVRGSGAAAEPVEPIRGAGVFRALDERGGNRGLVTVNADPAAGASDAQSPDAVAAWLAPLAGAGGVRWLDPASGGVPGDLAERGQGTALDRTLAEAVKPMSVLPILIAALVLAVFELAMARWFSHASTDEPGGVGGGAARAGARA